MAKVNFQTNLGDITLEIDEVNTPITAKNFLAYVKEGFYDNTIFHRVIDGFVVQGGGFTPEMQQKPTKNPIVNEAKFGIKNEVGTISMARTNNPDSATSQFFINLNDNNFLNYKNESEDGAGYCAFGKVIKGMDVIKKMSHTNTINKAGHQDVPETNIILEKAEIVSENVA